MRGCGKAIGATLDHARHRAEVHVTRASDALWPAPPLMGALTGAAGGHNDQGNADRQQIAQATRAAPPASGCHRDHSGQTT
jgi:hypothetical protein